MCFTILKTFNLKVSSLRAFKNRDASMLMLVVGIDSSVYGIMKWREIDSGGNEINFKCRLLLGDTLPLASIAIDNY